jgi:hypothetical protein
MVRGRDTVEAIPQAEAPDAEDDARGAWPAELHHREHDDDDTSNGGDPPIASCEVQHEVPFLHWNAMSHFWRHPRPHPDEAASTHPVDSFGDQRPAC